MTSNGDQSNMELDKRSNKKADSNTEEVKIKIPSPINLFLYRVWDIPPIPVSLVFSLQICLQLVSVAVTNAILISTTICGDSHVTAKLMSTNMFMAGLTSLIQATIGVRLPVFQGPSIYYVVPLLTMADMPEWACDNSETNSGHNMTSLPYNMTESSMVQGDEMWRARLLEVSGVLMVVSAIHALIGASGIGGVIAKIIGPLTIAPAVIVMILKVLDSLIKFCLIHVGVAAFTLCILVILTTYMANVLVPVPYWTPSKGWRFVRSKFLRTYAVLISIALGWILCHILTVTGALTEDESQRQYQARTDSQLDTITLANWFYFPYPGQFGMPTFGFSLFFGLLVAMLSSVIDSLADYDIITRICQIPKPPAHAINRGLLIEGVCSVLSGAFGAGMATSTNVAVTGSLAISGVTSRRVFQFAGVALMFLGVVGKIGAFFVIIPKPVVGPVLMIILGSVTGVLLAELNDYEMKRPRNCMTVGLAIVLGHMIPKMILKNQDLVDTGNPQVNQMITAMFGTPLFVAGVVACFLDNTLPGGRGKKPEEENMVSLTAKEEAEAHRLPYVQDFFERCRWTRFCPFLPGFQLKSGKTRLINTPTIFNVESK